MSDTLSALREELVKVEGREAQVKGEMGELVKVEGREAQVKEEMEELNEQVEKFREDMAELRSRVEGVEEEIQELKKRGSDDTSSLGNVKRQMTAKETYIEQLNARKQEIVESCELNQIKLPTTDSSNGWDSSGPGSVVGVHLVDPGERVFRLFEAGQSSPTGAATGRKGEDGVNFKGKMESISTEIERTAPNLKALDQYESLREKEREFNEEFDAAQKAGKEIADKYNAVKRNAGTEVVEAKAVEIMML